MTHSFKRYLPLLASLTACALILPGCENTAPKARVAETPKTQNAQAVVRNPALWPKPVSKVAKDPAMEQKIDSLIAKMTLEQKVGQTIQPEIRSISLADIKKYHIGSILNGGGAFPNNNKLSKAEDCR